MKKYMSVICFAVVVLSGSAFAQPDGGVGSVFSRTDAQLAPVIKSALARYQAADIPAASPASPVVARSYKVRLVDITEKYLHNGEVVSGYPAIYNHVPSEENALIIKVFSFFDARDVECKIEVYYTGGDWMQYGFTYIVTNAGGNNDRVRAYFIASLSTPDREEGAVAPGVDPFDIAKLTEFISSGFLDAAGGVKSAFSSIAELPASGK